MELTELKHRPLFFHSNVRGLLCVTAIKEVLQAAESWGVLSCSQDFFCKYQCVRVITPATLTNSKYPKTNMMRTRYQLDFTCLLHQSLAQIVLQMQFVSYSSGQFFEQCLQSSFNYFYFFPPPVLSFLSFISAHLITSQLKSNWGGGVSERERALK